jgi:ABC-type dipeptide/oligopeptide/nickel transport system permease subunit
MSVLYIASANFLGIGLQPPTADWGLMIAENRPGLATNALAVLVPAACIAWLTISASMFADGIARSADGRQSRDLTSEGILDAGDTLL